MSKKTTSLEQAIILFAGDSGDGMQLAGSQFTETIALQGHDLSTLPDFPAEIRAPGGTVSGVSGFKIHFGSRTIFSPGDACDVLVCMNAAALKKNLSVLKKNGIIIVNTSGFDPKNLRLAGYENSPLEDLQNEYKIFSIDISKQVLSGLQEYDISTKEKERCKNMFALGFVYWLFSKPIDHSIDFLKSKFGEGTMLYDANETALKLGYHYGEITDEFTERYTIAPAQMPKGRYRNISGNEALALGLMAAAQKMGRGLFYGGYPITPASDILHFLSKFKHLGVKTFQAEDEIAAITSAIGAAYGGDVAVTASSGPGIALKTEGLGLAFMLELPLVVVNVQRGGPSTGLPTKTEQADLMQAVYGRNGEAPIPVFAPATPSDCFMMAYMAVKTAWEFTTPVFLLSDGYIANGSEPWKFPSLEELPEIKVPLFEQNGEEYLPYKRNEQGVRSLVFPGDKGHEHRIGSLEKEHETGNVSYDSNNHQLMVQLRQKKFDSVASTYPPLEIEHPETDTLIISWGSTYGSVKEAIELLEEKGYKVSHLHLRYLNPLPLDLKNIIRNYRCVIVPEINNGQLIRILRDRYLVNAQGISIIKGLPLSPQEVCDRLLQMCRN